MRISVCIEIIDSKHILIIITAVLICDDSMLTFFLDLLCITHMIFFPLSSLALYNSCAVAYINTQGTSK
jgi:hypothetical protein